MKARFFVDVEFDGDKTESESIATALDKVVSNGLATLFNCLGRVPAASRRLASSSWRMPNLLPRTPTVLAPRDTTRQGRDAVAQLLSLSRLRRRVGGLLGLPVRRRLSPLRLPPRQPLSVRGDREGIECQDTS